MVEQTAEQQEDHGILVHSSITAGLARDDNLGLAREKLDVIRLLIEGAPPAKKQEQVMTALMWIWPCRRTDFCEEALNSLTDVLSDQLNRDFVIGIFSHSLEYVNKARDPYILLKLNPDIRIATRMLIYAFDTGRIGEVLPEDYLQ